jgi:3-mercaptopyruvate sulfurtransferase SseA
MRNSIDQKPILQILSQTGMILILAATLGILVNEVRPDKLDLWLTGGSEKQPVFRVETRMLISLEEAETRFLHDNALFLDARSPEIYEQAHIMRARNLPWESFEQNVGTVMAGIRRDRFIIIYCDGQTLSVDGDLAVALALRGYRNVRVLVNGWNLWFANELPIEAGAKTHAGVREMETQHGS